MKRRIVYYAVCCILLMTGCGKPAVPKEYGYRRIELPVPVYTLSETGNCPYRFLENQCSRIVPVVHGGEPYWIDIHYPAFDARIHCSYKPVRNNLRELSRDAQEFVYSHAIKASAIREHEYNHGDNKVYGILYDLEGNTASPVQFYLTDSVRHFFRGAVYFNCIPNQDSLAPVTEYLRNDITRLMESFEWK